MWGDKETLYASQGWGGIRTHFGFLIASSLTSAPVGCRFGAPTGTPEWQSLLGLAPKSDSPKTPSPFHIRHDVSAFSVCVRV